MSVVYTRRAHLERAIEEKGGLKPLAAALGVPVQNIYALRSGARNVGHKMARRIEDAMGWGQGAMDSPVDSPDIQLELLINSVSEADLVEVLRAAIPDLSDEGAAIVTRALLERSANQ